MYFVMFMIYILADRSVDACNAIRFQKWII